MGKWRARFVEDRLDGLFDEPRPGPARTITDRQVEEVIVKTLEEKPVDATHWSSRSMAKATGMSQSAIVRIWRAFELQPWRAESFKLSTDPLFVDKLYDICGLYLDPPERAVVLCVDEKSADPGARSGPADPAAHARHAERRSHDYVRHGTTSLFAALDMATGRGDRLAPPPASGHRVQEVPGAHRRRGPRPPRRPPGPGQLRHP